MPHTGYMSTEEYVFSQKNLDNLARMWAEASPTFPHKGVADAVEEPVDPYDYNPTDAECDAAADAYERRMGL